MATIKEIANYTGLSVATISRALSSEEKLNQAVKPRTLQKVRLAAEALGYRPNREAAFMRKQRKAAIGVFVPDYANALVANLIFGMSEVAAAEGFPINFYPGMDIHDFQEFVRDNITNKNAGLISYPVGKYHSPEAESLLLEYYNSGGKVLLINTDRKVADIPSLDMDEAWGGIIAAQKLCSISDLDAVVMESNESFPHRVRLQSFADEVKNLRKDLEVIPYRWCDDAPDFFEKLRQSGKKFAFFCTSDLLTMKFLHLAGSMNLHVPLIGYDNPQASFIIEPELHSIQQPFREQGKLAMQMLINMLNGVVYSGSTRIKPYLTDASMAFLKNKY